MLPGFFKIYLHNHRQKKRLMPKLHYTEADPVHVTRFQCCSRSGSFSQALALSQFRLSESSAAPSADHRNLQCYALYTNKEKNVT